MDKNFKQAVRWLYLDETGPEARALGGKHLEELFLPGAENWLRDTYWTPLSCSVLSFPLDYFLFDLGFRFSTWRVGRWVVHYNKEHPEQVVREVQSEEDCRRCILWLNLLSRKAMKSKSSWQEEKHRLTNRANRPLKRALRALEKEDA